MLNTALRHYLEVHERKGTSMMSIADGIKILLIDMLRRSF